MYESDIPAVSNLYAQLDMWEVKWENLKHILPTSLPELLKHTDRSLFHPYTKAVRIEPPSLLLHVPAKEVFLDCVVLKHG